MLKNQKGLAHIAVMVILALGLGALLYLSQKAQIFKPRASTTPPVNLLRNGSFENLSPDGTISNWVCESSVPLTPGTEFCRQDLKVRSTQTTQNPRNQVSAKLTPFHPSDFGLQLAQIVEASFDYGEEVCLRVHVQKDDPGDRVTVGVQSTGDLRKERVFHPIAVTARGGGFEWMEETVRLDFGDAKTPFQVYLRASTRELGTSDWFDEVSLVRGRCSPITPGSIVEPLPYPSPSPTPGQTETRCWTDGGRSQQGGDAYCAKNYPDITWGIPCIQFVNRIHGATDGCRFGDPVPPTPTPIASPSSTPPPTPTSSPAPTPTPTPIPAPALSAFIEPLGGSYSRAGEHIVMTRNTSTFTGFAVFLSGSESYITRGEVWVRNLDGSQWSVTNCPTRAVNGPSCLLAGTPVAENVGAANATANVSYRFSPGNYQIFVQGYDRSGAKCSGIADILGAGYLDCGPDDTLYIYVLPI